jgi:hypothetical protein
VIGVEIGEELYAIAPENIDRARPRMGCRDIELYTIDGRAFRIPPEVTAIYLANPSVLTV